MFGHQDDQQHDQHHDDNSYQEPQHDGVLDSTPHQGDDAVTHPDEPTDSTPPQMDYHPSDDQPTSDEPATNDSTSSTPAPSSNANDLLDIKQEALKQLSPLVGHLDQTPEEKFRTTMMMIQASDDQSLVQVAYEAAQAIGDEKAKAQALLDIVNEINYFTHQGSSEA